MIDWTEYALLFVIVFYVLVPAVCLAALIYLFSLVIKALKLYIRSQEGKPEYAVIKKTLGQTIKSHRERCRMTQEFVAESLGVSRQAVSKWENGISDPSTSNLLALAKLFKVSAEELLQNLD